MTYTLSGAVLGRAVSSPSLAVAVAVAVAGLPLSSLGPMESAARSAGWVITGPSLKVALQPWAAGCFWAASKDSSFQNLMPKGAYQLMSEPELQRWLLPVVRLPAVYTWCCSIFELRVQLPGITPPITVSR